MVNNLIYLFTEKKISKLVNYLCFTNDKNVRSKCKLHVKTCAHICYYRASNKCRLIGPLDRQRVSCALMDA
jgi:hypothetical protein